MTRPLPLSKFFVKKFRGLQDIVLDDLRPVNILVGINNSGKTTLLEALAVYARPFDIYEWISTAWRREIKSSRRSSVEALKWLFPQTAMTIVLEGEGSFQVKRVCAGYEEMFRPIASRHRARLEDDDAEEKGGKLVIEIRAVTVESRTFEIWDTENKPYPKMTRPALPVATITPVTHRTEQLTGISELLKHKLKDEALTALRLFDERVRDIVIVTQKGMRPTIEIDHADFEKTAPVSAFGDGMRRALMFALALPRAKHGLLLVDEIETAIHVSALQKLYNWLVQVCQKNDTQLFVTTHSLEAVDALLMAHASYDDLAMYRLGHPSQPVQRLDGDLVNQLRNERGLDVR